MHILFTIRYFHPFVGGTEKQALTLASRLVARGVAVTILTGRFRRAWQGTEVVDGVRVVRLASPRMKVLGALFYLVCLACYLIRHRREYSLIHTFQISYNSWLSILVARMLRKPVVLKLASSGSGGDIQRARHTPWGRIFLHMAGKADRIISVSSNVDRELLREKVPAPVISRVANGVDLARYRQESDKAGARRVMSIPEKKTIIYTGRLSGEKGVDFLIRSFSKMKGRQQCQLLIIGDGPERDAILGLIKQCRSADTVRIIPAAQDIHSYLNASDLFVLPSRFEGLSNSLLEAMACGLPVISTRVGGSTDIIQDGINGLLVDVENEHQLMNAMARVLNDQKLSDHLGRHARLTVEADHDMVRIADRYLAIYTSLHRNGKACASAHEQQPVDEKVPHGTA